MSNQEELKDQEVAQDQEKKDLSVKQSISKNAIGLALFAFFTAGLIGITQVSTSERISNNVEAFQQKSLLELMPQGLIDSELLNDQHLFDDSFKSLELLNSETDAPYYLGFKDSKIQSIILPVTAPDGYTGNIKMICAISPNGNVLGVRVIEHKETPGLGDKIDIKKDDWITSFNGKNLDNITWAVTKDGGDFDAFTGATITPRAVVKAINNALMFYQANQSIFLNHTQVTVNTTENN